MQHAEARSRYEVIHPPTFVCASTLWNTLVVRTLRSRRFASSVRPGPCACGRESSTGDQRNVPRVVSLRCPPPRSQCCFVFARRELDHPNIVKYLGTESAATTLIIFLEYVSGGSIATMVEKFGALHESVVQRCDPEGPVTVTVVELTCHPHRRKALKSPRYS